MKKNQYLSTTLDGFLNESKTFMLKRGYGQRGPVVVGSKGNVRDHVLPYVNENRKVSQKELKRFIAGLNETSKNPGAAANMWIKRNTKYFITENRNGVTYFKLSKIGSRLMNRVKPMLEQKDHDFIDNKKGYDRPGITSSANENCDECGEEICKCDELEESEGAGKEIKTSKIEKYLASKKKKMHKKSVWANLLEGDDIDEDEDENEEEKIEESIQRKSRMSKLLAKMEANKKYRKINEEEEEDADDDELTFDDLDLGDNEEEGEAEEGEAEEGEDLELEDEAEDEAEEGVENVEIAEFILTVDDPEAAIAELEEIGVTAEMVDAESEEGMDSEEDADAESEEDMDYEEDADAESEEDMDLNFDDESDEESGDDLDLGLEEADESDEDTEDLDLDLEGDEEGDDLDLDIDAETEEDSGDEVEFDEVDIDAEDDEDAEAGQKIKVGAEHADKLVKWLEEKGVDIEEIFGGELEIEDDEEAGEDSEDMDYEEDEEADSEDMDYEEDEEDEEAEDSDEEAEKED